MIQYPVKRIESYFPLADMLVAIDPGPQRRLRIIYVNYGHPAEPEGAVNFRKRFVEALGCSKVPSGGKQMRGINADSQRKSRALGHNRSHSSKRDPIELPCPAVFSSSNCKPPSLSPRTACFKPCAMAAIPNSGWLSLPQEPGWVTK